MPFFDFNLNDILIEELTFRTFPSWESSLLSLPLLCMVGILSILPPWTKGLFAFCVSLLAGLQLAIGCNDRFRYSFSYPIPTVHTFLP